MRSSPRFRFALVSSLGLLLFHGAISWAADPPDRVSPAPQLGFRAGAPEPQAYVPDHVLLKLTPEARRMSRVPASWRWRQELPGNATGLAAVDRALGDVGVRVLRRAMIEPANAAESERLGIGRWLMVELSSPRAAELVDRLSRLPEVEAVTFDYLAFPAVVPSDPLYSMHWGHNNTAQMLSYNWANGDHETGSPVGTVGFDANAQTAWNGTQGFGSSSVIIGIIDSGVQASHPDLLQVAGYDFGDNDSNPDDNSTDPEWGGHGTACAGIAASRANSLGSVGIAAGCSIMPLKVVNSSGDAFFSSIANALLWGADHGANVLSMSLGSDQITSDPFTDDMINYAFDSGCTILAATGNDNKSIIEYPASHANVIGVGAASPCGERKRSSSNVSEVDQSHGVITDPNGYTCDGERWWGSNYGVATASAAGAVDVIAPTILPTTDLLGSAGSDPSDYRKWFNGTSCATPYAAGVCALIKSKNPLWTPSQIRTQLLATAQDVVSVESGSGWDRYAGYGMVDAAAAVPSPDQITVTFPNGGEDLPGGGVYYVNITWTWVGSFSTVNIDYSTNGGSTWIPIVSNTPNDGSHSWTVPGTTTTQARVRVSGGTATDMSDANFSIDATSPGAVTNLVATPTCAGVQLSWTNTGDDGSTGTAAMVDIRRSTNPINNASFNNTPQLIQFPPSGPAGSTQSYTDPVGACSPDYYYAIKIRDEVFNYSFISNVVHQQSTCTGCGGGGGCPFAHVLTADGWTEENSILGRSLDGAFVRDAYRVKAAPLVEDGVYRLKIREDEQEITTLDRVRLVAMDHDPGLVAFALEGRPALGRVAPARQVVTVAGEELAQTLAGRFLGRPGDELVFDFAGSQPGGLLGTKNQILVIRPYKKHPTGFPTPIARNGPQHDAFVLGNSGIRLEAQDGSGRWTAVATRYPREHEDDIVVEAPEAKRYRLVFVGEHGITFVGRLEPVAGAGTEASLIAATHSRDADVRAAVRDDDGVTLTLGHGEQLELSFRLPEPAVGKVRDVFLLSTGVYTTATQGAEAARTEPLRLSQNQPNPFRVATEIGFTLPRAADVRLEVFDPLGRRIAILAQGRMTSGAHSISWNRLDPGGSPVKPGVYLYRLTAGREIAQKRMIVLP